jgi:RND family efflux transporter MFP subunit
MKRNDNYMWILPSIFILLFLFSVKFCTRKINDEYIAGKAERQDISLFVSARGEIEARDIVPIGLDIELGVDEIYFKEGDYVKQGDLIIRFSEYQEEQYKKEIDEIKEMLAAKNSKLRFEKEKHQLSGKNNIEELQKLRGEIQSLQNSLIVRQNKKRLIVRDITSPVSGYIIKINAVKGGTNDPAKPVLVLAKKTDIKIVTEPIAKEKAQLIQAGNTALIISVNNPEKEFEATVYKIDDSQGAGFAVIELLTKNVENRYLHEILNVKIFYQKRENVIAVPSGALIKTEGKDKKAKYYVYTIDKENKVKKRTVDPGLSNGEVTEIKKGLEEGEEIILTPDKKLENNTIVRRKDIGKEKREREERLKKIKEKNNEYNEEIEKNNREILKLEKESGIKRKDTKKAKEEIIQPQQKAMTLEEMEEEDRKNGE